jgi:hypothetical protein
MIGEVNLWTCLILFTVYFIYDVLYAQFILSVQKLQSTLSATISGAMYVISAVGIIKYTDNPWYLLPVALGASLGTFCFIRREKSKVKKRVDIKKNDI